MWHEASCQRAWPVLIWLMGALPASAEEAPPPLSPSDPSEVLAVAERVLPIVSSIRALPVAEAIDKRVVTQAAIRAILERDLARHYPGETLRAKGQALAAFGLLPPQIDLPQAILQTYTSQVAGMYDPEDKRLYLADWIPAALQEDVIVHELTHALQDQRFDLTRYFEAAKGNSEAATARHAVVEGEAMAVMLDYRLAPQGASFTSLGDLPQMALAMRQALTAFGSETRATLPTFLEESMLFPYVEGLLFIRQVRLRHPWSWTARLYADPPDSTEQILHPEKYLDQRDSPTAVSLPDLQPALGPSWRTRDEDTLGEFAVAALLRRWTDEPTATLGSEGWDGDQYRFYTEEAPDGGGGALVWASVWDTPRDAQEFTEAYVRLIQRRDPEARRLAGAALRWTTQGAVTEVMCAGDRVTVVQGIPPDRIAVVTAVLEAWRARLRDGR